MRIELELFPFDIPTAVRVDGVVETASVPLTSLNEKQLHELCADFRHRVFERAGVQEPPITICDKCVNIK